AHRSAVFRIRFGAVPARSIAIREWKIRAGDSGIAREFDSVPLGVRCEPERSHKNRFARDNPVFIFARTSGDSPGEHHRGEPLLQSAHSAAGDVSPVGWILSSGGSAGGSSAAA